MDGPTGTKHVPFSRIQLSKVHRQSFFLAWISFAALAVVSLKAFAQISPGAGESVDHPIHWSGKKQLWDRKSGLIRLEGAATVRQHGEVLTADTIFLNLNDRTVSAVGNCIYIAKGTIISAREIRFNLDTRTGMIIGGRVSTDSFALAGERISRLGEGRFQTFRGEYTTCKDCPQSWSFHGEDVELEFGGYAHMSNVRGKIRDVPVVWFPYLVFPLKTKRQSGLLPPRIRFTGDDGFVYVQPVFWEISRSTDATLSLGHYSARGFRGELEARYVLSERSRGQANFFYQYDKTVERRLNSPQDITLAPAADRWALNVEQTQVLPFGIEEKLRLVEVSDSQYPINFSTDVPGHKDSVLTSGLSFAHSTSQVSSYLAGRRFRNLLSADPLVFDSDTVQLFPTAVVTTNDKSPIPSLPVSAGLTLGVANFTRSGPTFDYDVIPGVTPSAGTPYVPGVDPIRKATRVAVTPSLYTTLRPGDVFSLVPSAQYRTFFYSFHNVSGMPNLVRSYLLTQAQASTQLERVYETRDVDTPRIKHIIRPSLTYSVIPMVREDRDHNFLKQVEYAQNNGFSGYNFDNNDIVPIDSSRTYNNYFEPLGNSLSYGVTTELIRRKGRMDAPGASYQRFLEFGVGQNFNFRELRNSPEERQPFSRVQSSLSLAFDHLESTTYYYYFPYAQPNPPSNRNKLSTSLAYVFERAMHQRVLAFERSFALGYAYDLVERNRIKNLTGTWVFSLNDYVRPVFSFDYHLSAGAEDPSRFFKTNLGVDFQSPSQCWKIALNFARSIEKISTSFDFNLTLNLTGAGFEGLTESGSRYGLQ